MISEYLQSSVWTQGAEEEMISKAVVEISIDCCGCGMANDLDDQWGRACHVSRYETLLQMKLVEVIAEENLEAENERTRPVGAYRQDQEILDCDQVSECPSPTWHSRKAKDSEYVSVLLLEWVNSRDVCWVDFRNQVEMLDGDAWILKGEMVEAKTFYL